MSAVQVTIELPEELIERARTVGLELESQTQQIIALLEAQVKRREAVLQIREIAEQIQTLPSSLKLTPGEIQAEIDTYWSERTAQNDSH